jgi:hypothetical protein
MSEKLKKFCKELEDKKHSVSSRLDTKNKELAHVKKEIEKYENYTHDDIKLKSIRESI